MPKNKRIVVAAPTIKEAELLFKQIGLASEEERNRYTFLSPDEDPKLKYEILFSNNTEVENG